MAETTDIPTLTPEKTNQIAATNIIDLSHPFYIQPSDYPSMNLVSTVFDGKSYGGWRIIALSAKNKLEFINGYITFPSGDLVL